MEGGQKIRHYLVKLTLGVSTCHIDKDSGGEGGDSCWYLAFIPLMDHQIRLFCFYLFLVYFLVFWGVAIPFNTLPFPTTPS